MKSQNRNRKKVWLCQMKGSVILTCSVIMLLSYPSLRCFTKEYCHRNGFPSEHISGSNSTAQNLGQGLGPCVLSPSLHPSSLGCTCTELLSSKYNVAASGSDGESTELFAQLASGAQGLKPICKPHICTFP